MAGINSLLFLKVLCDIERQKIETKPDERFVEEAFAPTDELDGQTESPCAVKLYMHEKYGIGGSLGSKRYACPRCSCLFKCKRHLRLHLRFQCKHKCLGCSECYACIHKSFKQVNGDSSKSSQTFTCSSCQTSFLTSAGLSIHEECHSHPDKVLECDSCSQHFNNRWEFDKHQKTHVTSVVYDCKDCAKAFSTPSNLAKHVRVRHKTCNDTIGKHFLAQLGSEMELSNHHYKNCGDEHKEDYSDIHLEEASSRVCGLCNHNFKYCPLNRSHVCSEFPPPESLIEEMFEETGLQCPACSQTFSSYIALKMHFGAHTGIDPLTCTLCDKKFSSLRKVDYHFEFHGRNTCGKCGVFFSTKAGILLHHCGYTQRCFTCSEVFPTRNAYEKHLLVHPLPKNLVYKCTECKKSFLKESYFRAHEIEHTGTQPFACLVCNQKFLMYGPFRKHVLTHITSSIIKCKTCGKSFRSAKRFAAHANAHSPQTDTCFPCKTCSQNFKTESDLKTHECNCKVVNMVEKTDASAASGFQCEDCSTVFRKQHQLFIHQRDNHGKTAPYLFHCNFCQRGFYHKNHLKSHESYCSRRNDEERKQISVRMERMKQHTSVKRHLQCPKCDKKYFTEHHLNIHMYVHRDPSTYPYQCTLCGIGYAREWYLRKHLEKCQVSDPKKVKSSYRCKTCGAFFLNEKTFNRHMEVHGREWVCSLCKEKFMTKRGHDNHKTLCTAETAKYKTFRKPRRTPRILSCPKCERQFQLRDRFEAHVASHEGIIRYQCSTCCHKFMSINNFKRHRCKYAINGEAVKTEGDICAS